MPFLKGKITATGMFGMIFYSTEAEVCYFVINYICAMLNFRTFT